MGFTCCSLASQFVPPLRSLHPTNRKSSPFSAAITPPPSRKPISICIVAAAAANSASSTGKDKKKEVDEVVEVEEDLPWIQEKALDLVEFTGSVTQAIPGPRVGPTSFPWILAVPLAYAGLTFVIAFVKTVRKFTSPKAKRRRLVCLLNLCSQNQFSLG